VLGIPFYVWDFAARFTDDVVDDFVAAYANGQTPNPCLRCNEKIKFSALLDRALALGFDAVCTGHYAQLDHASRPPVLRRAVDADKDQSYVLAVLTADQLRHAMFPLGDTPKPAVRAEAAARAGCGWPTSPDSPTSASSSAPAASRRPPGARRGRWSTPGRVRCWPGTTVSTGSPSASGAAWDWAATRGGRTAALRLGIELVSGTVRVGPAEALDVHRRGRGTPCGAAVPRAGGRWSASLRVRARRPRPRPPTDGRDPRRELGEPLRARAGASGAVPAGPGGDVVLGSAHDPPSPAEPTVRMAWCPGRSH
jgi:tRNA-specific 2-thiouridylase